MKEEKELLEHIKGQKDQMLEETILLANINSNSYNVSGLEDVKEKLKTLFSCFNVPMAEHESAPDILIDQFGKKNSFPLGKSLFLEKKIKNCPSVLLAGHMDTVYPLSSPFQTTKMTSKGIINGPGVADMKGGLIVLLHALKAFEQSKYASKISWEVLINPDEEIGSPGSLHLFEKAAKRNSAALIFEPAFPNGGVVTSRGSSLCYILLVHGKSAHVGRFFEGRSSLYAIAPFITALEKLNSPECIINCGEIHSGDGYNVVPALAFLKINVRTETMERIEWVKKAIEDAAQATLTQDGITYELIESQFSGPKPYDKATEQLFSVFDGCASELSLDIPKLTSKGLTDGNTLAFHGLPTIDSFGVIGGNLHSPEEYMEVDSLVTRTQLAFLFLCRYAQQFT